MDHFFDVDFLQNKCTVLEKYLQVLYSLSGGIFNVNYVRLKLRYFLFVYFCFGYLVCSIPPLKGLILDLKLQHIFDVIGFLTFIHYVVINTYLFYSNRNEFQLLFDLIIDHSNQPVVTIDMDNSSHRGDYLLKETNILKVCFRIWQGLISWYVMLYVSEMGKHLFSSEATFDTHEKTDFIIPFICSSCSTPLSYILAFTASFFMVLPFGIFQNMTVCFFVVLSIYFKNRAIALYNDIKYYSDIAHEKFENYNQLEEQELKRRNPSRFQLREIDQLKERQVRDYMSKVHQWIQIHQRLMKCIIQYQRCAKKIMDLSTSFSFISVTFLGYFCMRYALDNGYNTNHYFFSLMLYLLMFYACGRLGNDLNDVGEIISDAVYSTPWVYLPANEQKVILNFLTITQRTHSLVVFGVFSLSVELVPSQLNDAYGYAQTMRLLATRTKN